MGRFVGPVHPAAVAILGGTAPVTATGGSDGLFATTLPLTPDGLNTFAATASLGGSTAGPQPLRAT